MLYLIHGSDYDTVRTKVQGLVQVLHKKRPDASTFTLAGDNFTEIALDEYIGGQGLFANKYIISVHHSIDDDAMKSAILERLKDIAGSDNVFIFREGEIDAKTLEKFKKYADKIEEHQLKTSLAKKEEFNVFSLGDALGSRDKAKLWSLYIQAKMSGLEDENIHGVLVWQIKSMVRAAASGSANDSGLKPFVYTKSKSFAARYPGDSLVTLLDDFVSMYHESRRGKDTLGELLERYILQKI